MIPCMECGKTDRLCKAEVGGLNLLLRLMLNQLLHEIIRIREEILTLLLGEAGRFAAEKVKLE